MFSVEWTCRACRWGIVENRDQILARLRSIGMLSRDAPDEATIWELARVASGRLTCPQCGAAGLGIERTQDDDAELWGDPIPCEFCAAMIPAERLAVFPNSKVCAKCQAKLDRGETAGGVDYCPRCGAPMVVRATRGDGITRYQQVCSQGARCRR